MKFSYDKYPAGGYAVRHDAVIIGRVFKNRFGWAWSCATKLPAGIEKTRDDAAEMILYHHQRNPLPPPMWAVDVIEFNHNALDARMARRFIGLQLFTDEASAVQYAKDCVDCGEISWASPFETYGIVRKATENDKEFA